MSKITVTQKSPEEIAADFEATFKDVKPATKQVALTQADRLAPYRKQIMKQRVRGLNWKQIAEGMAQPRINEKVSPQLLKKLFGPRPKQPEPVRPPVARLVLDPATGKPVILAKPPVPPMTPPEHAKFDPVLKDLLPTIVKAKQSRRDAMAYASLASERLKWKEVDRFLAVVESELDGLTEANCSAYGIAPELIAPWRRRW